MRINYISRIYRSKNFGIYYLLAVTLINILLWIVFRVISPLISSVLNDSPISVTLNSVDYYVALTQGVSSSLIALFALFSDNIIWRKISFIEVFKMPGSEYNFLMLAFLLAISLLSLYIVIPYKNYELLYIFDNLRILWIIILTFSYLWTYVGGIWKSHIIMHGVILAGIGQIIRTSTIFLSATIAKIINLLGLLLIILAVIIFLYYTIKWCQSIWNMKYEDYTFEIYCCNIYLIFFWLSAFLISFFYFKDGIPSDQNLASYQRVILLYINMTYIVGVALTQSRGARVHKDICQVCIKYTIIK